MEGCRLRLVLPDCGGPVVIELGLRALEGNTDFGGIIGGVDVKKEVKLLDRLDKILSPLRDNGDDQQLREGRLNPLEQSDGDIFVKKSQIVEKQLDCGLTEKRKKFFF
jgi:hypothetical protein